MPEEQLAPIAPGGVSVGIPVRDGGELFAGVLQALDAQSVEHELLVCDSGSTDGSPELARAHGARVIELEPGRFSHGGARNRLMSAARGDRVALLTQDSQPADARWLERLLGGFELAGEVGLVYGRYRPRAGASLPVRLELERWFGSLSPAGSPRVDRLRESERSLPAVELIGRLGFFTDANACISRSAWERVPFREVAYAEDRVLAIDMLRAGFAKVFLPDAAVIHSHEYSASERLRRSFDEWRALREVYGWREPLDAGHILSQLRGELGYARRELTRAELSRAGRAAALLAVARHHALSRAGALLGSRSEAIPDALRAALSLERRGDFAPLAGASPEGGPRPDPGSEHFAPLRGAPGAGQQPGPGPDQGERGER